MKLSQINESIQGDYVVLYRQDPRFFDGDQQKLISIIKSGKYDGRYYAYTKEAVYEYYSRKCLILTVKLPMDEIGVDGAYWDGPLLGERSTYHSLEEVERESRLIPEKYREEYVRLSMDALKNGGPVSSYYGSTSKEAFDLYLELSQIFIKDHLRKHGQVALLGRRLRFEELIDITLAD